MLAKHCTCLISETPTTSSHHATTQSDLGFETHTYDSSDREQAYLGIDLRGRQEDMLAPVFPGNQQQPVTRGCDPQVRDLGDGERAMVEASVVAGGGAGEERQLSFTFCMRRGVLGRKKGAWLTKMLVRGDIAAAEAQIARLQRGQSP